MPEHTPRIAQRYGRVLKRLTWFYRVYRLHLGLGWHAALKSAWKLAR